MALVCPSVLCDRRHGLVQRTFASVAANESRSLEQARVGTHTGLANAKTIDIQSGTEGNLTITTRKPKASPHAVAGAHIVEKLVQGPMSAAHSASLLATAGVATDLT